MDYFTKSLKIQEETSNSREAAVSLNNIGAIYNEQGDYSKAMDYFTKV